MDLTLKIEDILERNGSDFELSKLFKEHIKNYKASLPELFKKNQGKDFLVKHTRTLDSIISLMYKTILRRVFGNYIPMRNSIPISIVALGSYGREQLCVHSDIDLLISYKNVHGYNNKLIIEKLFYLALDSGLKLGHRVHEVSDLLKASKEDITIRTSLMESRFIIGSIFTWQNIQKELIKIRLQNQKEFILAKIDEAKKRRKKYPISMQPNIKESVGGLRDAQLIYWIAKTIYGVSKLKDLSHTLFSEDEYLEYRISLELLFRVRSALHLVANKQEDRLSLELMPQISQMLGFKDEKKLSSKVLGAQWRINNFTKIFVKKILRPYIYEASNICIFKHKRITKGIYQNNSRLFASFCIKKLSINTILEILINLEDKPYKFDAGFLNQLTYTNTPNPISNQTYTLLKELLKKKYSYCFFELFYEAGILHKLFTNFKKVLHLPQFDGYHHYPVDIHSIACIKSLENIKEDFLINLHNSLSQDEKLLLKIVVLLHDTGKGRKQDHSEVGAKIIVPFLKKLKLKEELIDRAVILVRHHILMSSIAFKENIYNEKVLYKFISKIKDSKNLKLLYILTYADINGVGGNTYNSFNSRLIYDLYINALEVSQNSDRITDASKRITIEKRVQSHSEFNSLSKILQKKVITIESNLFFYKHSAQDIINIAKKIKNIKTYEFQIKINKSLSIEIFRKIPVNIGYILSLLSHLDVASMEIFTLFDEVKYFKIEFIKNIEKNEFLDIEKVINNSFKKDIKFIEKSISIKKDEIFIDINHSLTHIEIKVHTSNQLGLLAYIMECFEELKINVVTAKIHSSKYKVRDNFLIEKQNDICNNIDKIYKLLSKDN